ncbi:MAG: ABC transporter ATP-binding protein [Eubacterium sp.]
MKSLEIKNLTKYYGSVRGVEDLSLSIEEGEIFGFIGPNGAGKSTTIRSVMDLINKTSGDVLVMGEHFDRKNIAIKNKIGYLPSEINLYEEMTVKKIFNYNKSFYRNVDDDKINRLSEKLQLDMDKKIEELSFGNRKKVGIILSLMHNPKLVIMDEATNGLDPLMQEAFYEIIKEEKQKGTTIFFSSHNLGEVKKLCDRVAIIKDGFLKKVDTIENLISGAVHFVTLECDDCDAAKKLAKGTIEYYDNGIRFMYNGNMNELVKSLSSLNINKLLIEEPSLEEIFMHYYE